MAVILELTVLTVVNSAKTVLFSPHSEICWYGQCRSVLHRARCWDSHTINMSLLNHKMLKSTY